MAINLYNTRTILQATELVKPAATFLRDRYFPTAPTDIVDTAKVNIDYVDENDNKLAPVVLPSKGAIPVNRAGYETHEFEPPFVAPERILTPEELLKRLPGENLASGINPLEREAAYIQKDIRDLDKLICNREEYMAAETLVNNGYTLKQYADKYGSSEYTEKEILFYTENANPATYTPATLWDATGGSPLADIKAIADTLSARGIGATDVIMGADALDAFINNDEIQTLLDNRRMQLGDISPVDLPNGATQVGTINVYGHQMTIFSYTRTYIPDGSTVATPYIPADKIVVTAPGIGRMAYAGIAQIEMGESDYSYYAEKRVPHFVADPRTDNKSFQYRSKPLAVPNVKNGAISATVVS